MARSQQRPDPETLRFREPELTVIGAWTMIEANITDRPVLRIN